MGRVKDVVIDEHNNTVSDDYTDWSIIGLFCELSSRDRWNIEDDTTRAIKEAILAKAREEGAEQGARRERHRLKAAKLTNEDRFVHDVRHYLIPARAFRNAVLAPTKESEK